MTPAGELTPVVLWTVDEVGPIGKGAHERDRKPVANGLAKPRLVLHIVSHVGQGVPLRLTAFVSDLLVTSGEGNRLEREELNLLRIVERELNDASDLLVVNAVDDRGNGNDIYAGLVKVLDCSQLDVKKVSNLAVLVSRVADSVKLKIGVTEPCFCCLFAELGALGELDSVCGRLHAVVADLSAVTNRIQEERRHRRFA